MGLCLSMLFLFTLFLPFLYLFLYLLLFLCLSLSVSVYVSLTISVFLYLSLYFSYPFLVASGDASSSSRTFGSKNAIQLSSKTSFLLKDPHNAIPSRLKISKAGSFIHPSYRTKNKYFS